MSYELTALVGRPAALARITDRPAVALADGFALVPLDERYFAERVLEPDDVEGLIESIGPDAEPASEAGTVAYLHIETFGGSADQTVLVWSEGALHLSERVADAGPHDQLPSNLALRLVGVVAADGEDEFATLGLGRHRSTEEWLADR